MQGATRLKVEESTTTPSMFAGTFPALWTTTRIMSYPNVYIDRGSFFHDEELKADGSNFIDWYQRLRGLLYVNDVLYVIQEPLGDAPGDSASEEEYDEYIARRDMSICV